MARQRVARSTFPSTGGAGAGGAPARRLSRGPAHPPIPGSLDRGEFGLTRPVDLLQGALTPTARKGWVLLDGGTYAVAVGDAWVVNDPLTGQGANLGSHTAWLLAEAIAAGPRLRRALLPARRGRMWQMAGLVTAWSNAFLQPPPPHVSTSSPPPPRTRSWPARSSPAMPNR